jgi:hypothetical protein
MHKNAQLPLPFKSLQPPIRSCSGCYYAVLSRNFGTVSCMKAKEIVVPEWGIDCPHYKERIVDGQDRQNN